jgi:hypothetical protein
MLILEKACRVRFVVAYIAAVLVLGCSDDKITGPGDEFLNPVKPNANSLIVSEVVFGDPTSRNQALQIDGKGALYFHGANDGKDGVGRLSYAGDIDWFSETVYKPHDFYAEGTLDLLVAGAHDANGDGAAELGYVSFFRADGRMGSQTLLTGEASDLSLYAIEPIWVDGGRPRPELPPKIYIGGFLVAGGEKREGRDNPFVAIITREPDGQLKLDVYAGLYDIQDRAFTNLIVDMHGDGNPIEFYAVSYNFGSNTGIGMPSVHRIAWPELQPPAVIWSQDIVVAPGREVQLGIDCFATDEEFLYLVGSTETQKEPPPSTGGSWQSGFAVSLTRTGEVRWLKDISATQYDDGFLGLCKTGDFLFVAGYGGEALFENEMLRGYGWLCMIAPDDGTVVKNLLFGSDRHSSWFGDIQVSDGVAHLVGSTREQATSNGSLGWLVSAEIHTESEYPNVKSLPAIVQRRATKTRARLEIRDP